MARVAGHLRVEDLEAGFRSARDPTAVRHFQVIWLLARGHTIADVAAVTSFVPRWIEQLLARYNAEGPEALGDLRRRNGGVSSVLRPALLERLRARLTQPPPDGGLWSSRKVAAWMAGELGLAAVLPQRGWEALKAIGWSVQKPRPRHPASATPEEREAFKKAGAGRRRGSGPAPGHAGRGLGHGRAPHRPEANPAPGLGAQGSAPDRSRPPPLQVALRHRLRPADLRRDLLVRVEWRLQAVLRRAAGAQARPSGTCRMASPSRSSPRCWRCSRAKPGRDASASSCLSATMPAGTPRRTWSCRRASGSSTCPRTRPSFSPPSTSGPSSTSRSPTSTSRPSPISNEPSQSVAGSSMAISLVSGQTSTGGPNQPSRPNQPESVSIVFFSLRDTKDLRRF